jgi:hypothetical protein
MKRFVLLSVVALVSLNACGDDTKVAATATEGDEFCTLVQVAVDDKDTLDSSDPSDSANVKLALSASIDSLSAAAAKAPEDIADTVNSLLDNLERLEGVLADNDFDLVKMSNTEEGKALIAEAEASTLGPEFDTYLTDKCGIETPEDDETTDDTTPADDTVSEDTTPADDTVSDDTVASDDPIVDLGEGEDAINQFLDFYELGTSTTLTDEERSCIVASLVDEVTGDELNQAISGNPSEEVQLALGNAFIDCNVEV